MSSIPLHEVPPALRATFASSDPERAATARESANVDRISTLLALIADGRFDELADSLTPDVRLDLFTAPGIPWVRHASGAEAVLAAIAHNFQSVRDQAPGEISLLARGDTVMTMSTETGRWASTGEPYRCAGAQEFTFREGRVAAFRSVVSFIG